MSNVFNINARYAFRKDTYANWLAADEAIIEAQASDPEVKPLLAAGEPGIVEFEKNEETGELTAESQERLIKGEWLKIGDGITPWKDLPWAKGPQGPAGESGASGVYIGSEEPADEDVNVWVDPEAEDDEIIVDASAYVTAEAESVIDRVIAAQGGRTFTFAAITDMHYGNGSYTDGIQHACQALKYIDENIKLDAVVVLGDYTDGYLTTNYDDAIADFKGVNYLLNGLRFAPNLRLQGNHDFYDNQALIHRFVQSYSDDVVWGNKSGGYYYKDFEAYKLRVICVNVNEENGIDDNNKPIGNVACSVAQYEWFINSLDLTTKENAGEWQTLILSHQPLDWYDSNGIYSFAQILNAYKNGTSWQSSTLGISCDYADKNPAKLIGNIHGHIHNLLTDYIHFGNVVNGNKSEIWRISTPEACIGRANHYDGAWKETTTYGKTTGTAEDTSFCIYCIDLDNYTINAVCYGAGYDRQLNYSDGTQTITYSITNNLTDVTNDNGATSIEAGQSYSSILTATAEGDMTVTVTMGGTDITDSAYSNGAVTISEVTGNIIITANVIGNEVEEPDEPIVSYTNQIPVSIDTDGSIYNGKGYKDGYRLNSSGTETELTGTAVTGFIPVKGLDVIRFKNIAMTTADSSGNYIQCYDSTFTQVAGCKSNAIADWDFLFANQTFDENGNLTSFCLESSSYNYAYIRVSCAGLDENSVITVNEEIT